MRAQKEESFIVHHGNFIPINWPKVVLWSEDNGLKLTKGYTPYFEPREIKTFVNHWDVCLSSKTCARVLEQRGISVHFCIDNDGTIYQLLDTNHAAWHAGSKKHNHSSIGVEISNAYYLKYQDWYVKNGFGERPIRDNAIVHGKTKEPFLDFYPVQMEALKALWKAVHIGIGIPLEYPKKSDGSFDTGLNKSCERGLFNGFCNHYNFTKTKIDCAGLDIPGLIEDVSNSNLYCLDRPNLGY